MVELASRQLTERLHAALHPLSAVLEAYLFGSCARNEAADHSDIDVALFVSNESLCGPGFGIAAEISAALQVALCRSDVDVVLLNDAPPLLYYRVLKDGVRVLSRDLAATTGREGMALSRYCDYVPQLQIIERVHQERMAQGRFGQ